MQEEIYLKKIIAEIEEAINKLELTVTYGVELDKAVIKEDNHGKYYLTMYIFCGRKPVSSIGVDYFYKIKDAERVADKIIKNCKK
jgi:hypothetical protein